MKKNQSCVVRDCDSTEVKNPDLKFHPIPKEDNIKKKWLKAINRSDEELTKRSKVCSKHFKNTDYTVTRFNYTVGDKNNAGTDKSVCEWKVLKTEVVPSQNLPEKSTFKIKISKKDNSKEVKVEEVKVKEEKDREKPLRMPKRPAPPPVEPPRETPSRSRRQASKEALKQMQLLLDDENEAVEIASDEDIIPVDPSPPPPPKKKFKPSHRKSSDVNVDREVSVLKSITNRNAENTLELDCWVEPLDEIQKARIQKRKDEEKEIQSKLDSLVNQGNAKVIHKGDLSTIIEISEYVQSAIQAAQVPPNPTPVVLNNTIGTNQGYQLVMDPRLKLIVGTVNQSSTPGPTPIATPQKVYQGKVQVAQNLHQTPTTSANNQTRMRTRRGTVTAHPPPTPPAPVTPTPTITTRSSLQTRSTPAKAPPPPPPSPKTVTPTRTQIATRSTPVLNKSTPIVKNTPVSKNTPPPAKKTVPVPTPPPPATRTRQSSSASVTNSRPSEDNVEGGLATGGGAGGGQAKKIVVDLTAEDGRTLPDSKEVAFNKLQGKTYPSLVVVARPHLRVQDVNVDRPKLDAKVKSVLMHAATKFTEWLIQQGLVRSEQKCSTHTTTQLKLGMYSDVTKFPYSGGYVWISECCPHRFVSVFSGSLFEGAPHPPMVILKLLYHWACQTNIQNVTQWVKVDNLYVKGMFTWLRAITTVALHTHLRQLGGSGTKVEVGVISLGTTSQDGNQRQVKVEVLGVLESASKLIRLRAVEPQTEGDRNYKRRFTKILEPVQQWVHPDSILVADLTVDKQTLHQMGFTNVIQSSSGEFASNKQIMEYLRRIVPRMFQNTLSLLSRQIIQQFLDELVWREWFGTSSLQAFDNIVLHLAEQTRYDNLTLITRLNRVAQNPFKNWALPKSVVTNSSPTSSIAVKTQNPIEKTPEPTSVQQANQKKQRNRKQELITKPAPQTAVKTIQQVPLEINRPPKSISPDVPEQMVPLENYYYGTIDNYAKSPKISLNMKCLFCKSVFDNNILLMNHLFKHAHNVSQDAQLCRYCLTSVPTSSDLLKHIASSHPSETKFDNGFVCLICETQYMNPFILGKHMSKEHCPSELPYQCGTCGYRCSNHKQAIDHFYMNHDNGSTIQCPFCLKSTTVFTSSRYVHQNMNYFIQHLQKHQRKQFAKRCGKCNLWFVQKDVLRDHQTRMHISQRGKPRLVPWNAPRNGVMVPKSKMDKYPGDADVINFTTLTLNVPKDLKCKECNSTMDTPKHFPSFESCQNPNCQYSTCCTNAMQEHNAKCSKTQNSVEKEKLPFEMFCICGFSDTDGNQMARHLAICERKSAYPSRTESQAAIVTHSMLDVLGLVRKPDETKKDEVDISVANEVKGDVKLIEKTDSEKMEEEVKIGEKKIKCTVDDKTNDKSKTEKIEEQTQKDIEIPQKTKEKTKKESHVKTMEVCQDTVRKVSYKRTRKGSKKTEDPNKEQETQPTDDINKHPSTTEVVATDVGDDISIKKDSTSRTHVNVSKDTSSVENTAAPMENEEKPDVGVTPLEDESTSVEVEAKPVENESSSVENMSTPIEDEPTPVEDESTPVENESTSVEDESTPVEDESTSVEDESTPVEDESIPVEDESIPVEDESTPVRGVSTPVGDETTPIENEAMHTEDEATPTEDEAKHAENDARTIQVIDDGTMAAENEVMHFEDEVTPPENEVTPLENEATLLSAEKKVIHAENEPIPEIETASVEDKPTASQDVMMPLTDDVVAVEDDAPPVEDEASPLEDEASVEDKFQLLQNVASTENEKSIIQDENPEIKENNPDERSLESREQCESISDIHSPESNTDLKETDSSVGANFKSIEDDIELLYNQQSVKDIQSTQRTCVESIPQVDHRDKNESRINDQNRLDELVMCGSLENNTENISNHFGDDDVSAMETTDLLVENKPREPDITAHIENLISDMVGENIDRSETEITRLSNREQDEKINDVAMASPSNSLDLTMAGTEILENEEVTPMETD